MKETFGKLLKDLRREKNVSQRELAEKIGVDFSYISKVENDRLPPPAAETTIKIARALGIPVEELLSHGNKLPLDLKDMLGSNAAALKFMNAARDMQLSKDEWGLLTENLKRLR
jgi:HTH-type transcriptional regulator, competence development regulator